VGDGEVGFGEQRWCGAGGTGSTNTVVYNTVEEIRRLGEELGKITGDEG
jgi:hypothetical protein